MRIIFIFGNDLLGEVGIIRLFYNTILAIVFIIRAVRNLLAILRVGYRFSLRQKLHYPLMLYIKIAILRPLDTQ